MSLRSITIAVSAAIVLAACSKIPSEGTAEHVSSAQTPNKDLKAAPNFALKDASGATVKLSDYKGKVVLVNFWATWCGPCQIEIPWFVDFQNTYKNRDFTIIGISEDDDGWKSVKPYVAEHKLNYPVVIGTDEVAQMFGGVDALPTTFVIGRDGRIAYTHQGLISKSDYQNEILQLLSSKSAAVRAPGGVFAFLRAE